MSEPSVTHGEPIPMGLQRLLEQFSGEIEFLKATHGVAQAHQSAMRLGELSRAIRFQLGADFSRASFVAKILRRGGRAVAVKQMPALAGLQHGINARAAAIVHGETSAQPIDRNVGDSDNR